MEQNKTGKYLKYAIGEIILVVIGILIALSINNWNENRISKIKETGILKDFQDGLKFDILQLDSIIVHYERAKFSINTVLFHLEDNLPNSDSLTSHFFNTTLIYDSGGLTIGVYETLKSTGLNLISNKKIRDLIISVYDEHNPWMEDWEKRYIDLIFEAQKNIYNSRFTDFWGGDYRDRKVIGTMHPINYETLKNDNEYKYLLRSQLNLIDWLISKPVVTIRIEAKKLLDLIENELNTYD
jgi:hypothetical protein